MQIATAMPTPTSKNAGFARVSALCRVCAVQHCAHNRSLCVLHRDLRNSRCITAELKSTFGPRRGLGRRALKPNPEIGVAKLRPVKDPWDALRECGHALGRSASHKEQSKNSNAKSGAVHNGSGLTERLRLHTELATKSRECG